MNLDDPYVKDMIQKYKVEESMRPKSQKELIAARPKTAPTRGVSSSGKVQNMYEVMPKSFLHNAENPHFDKHGFKLPFRLCCVAPSGSGKTNWLMNLISLMSAKPKGTFADITIITRNADEPLYKWLTDICDDVKIHESLNELPILDKMDKDVNHLVCIDDMVLEKNQDRIKNYYIRCRKLNCSIAYLSQSYFAIPKIIRNNCNYLVLLKLSGHREVNMILSEGGLGVSKDCLLKLYQDATAEKFSPFIIDYDEDPSKRYRKGFLEIMPVTQDCD